MKLVQKFFLEDFRHCGGFTLAFVLATVDEDGGGAAYTGFLADAHVFLYPLGVDAFVEGGLELGHVEAKLLGVSFELRAFERLLVLEENIVVLPELALGVSGHGGLGRQLGLVVESQWEMFENN